MWFEIRVYVSFQHVCHMFYDLYLNIVLYYVIFYYVVLYYIRLD